MQRIDIIDSHTGGEPTRLVIAGFPDLGNGSMAARLKRLANDHDAWRRAVILEPRGNDILVGALLCEPENPRHTCGVIFFNNAGYLGMCGHGTIGLITSLQHLGRITTGEHVVETPVGNVTCTLHEDGSVSIRNVRAWRYRTQVPVHIGTTTLHGDIAFGGNWFFLVDDHGESVTRDNLEALTQLSRTIMKALSAQGITGENGAEIDHIELFANSEHADSRSFVLCPGSAYDRSPCGTGTSAKLACLAADGKLAPGDIWRQESVIGSLFTASYQPGDNGGIIPTIRGTAHICAQTTLLLDPRDPFCWGIA
ncbi:MAG: 4-hydroxyproline epimerase [Cardiobacteriaceae bacterium]|nr:4-hydroxyproline epimerase [Cardiobacteriaceae bacterium]